MKKEKGEATFNKFYLMQYIQNIKISRCNQYNKSLMRYFIFFFWTRSSKSDV